MSVATRFFQLLCNKAIPVSSTGMTPFAVQLTFKNECSYSYGINRGMTVRSGIVTRHPATC
ncbi:hypothetical protein [Wolbachia endosymbiont of Muscidifurax uniraptor]|uniref:hypothetical protein n=1 Tax=Wolbachia endosymbiont of Muscidifurax uniraptor TaxID=77037 RepID=UPI0009811F27|nr:MULTISPECIES: hypothetical protein [Wolbachia]